MAIHPLLIVAQTNRHARSIAAFLGLEAETAGWLYAITGGRYQRILVCPPARELLPVDMAWINESLRTSLSPNGELLISAPEPF